MKKTYFAIFFAAFCITACQPTTQPESPSSTASSPQATAGPALFEIRDFDVDKEDASYGGASYTGRGTLVTKDPRLVTGSYLVFLSFKEEHENDGEAKTQVLLKDGIGPLQVGTYQTTEEEKKEKVRYYDWKIIGYTELHPGTFKAPVVPPNESKEPE